MREAFCAVVRYATQLGPPAVVPFPIPRHHYKLFEVVLHFWGDAPSSGFPIGFDALGALLFGLNWVVVYEFPLFIVSNSSIIFPQINDKEGGLYKVKKYVESASR